MKLNRRGRMNTLNLSRHLILTNKRLPAEIQSHRLLQPPGQVKKGHKFPEKLDLAHKISVVR